MHDDALLLTAHATQRAAKRAVPISVIKVILEYGESQKARDGARKHALSKASLKNLRQDFGAKVSNHMAKFRNAYVVSSRNAVITVVISSRPLFH